MAFLLGYWTGLPPSDWCVIDVRESSGLMSVPVEDGLHLLSVVGMPELTRGTPAARSARYADALRTFPGVLNPRLLDRAELVSGVVAVPETMLRGYRRPAAGPGWATVGDAGLLKHPATAQGIGDALQSARWVATALLDGGDLSGYEAWRDARAEGHDDFSFRAAHFPKPEAAGLYAGIAADPHARQQFLDTFTKSARITDVVTAERTERWRAASAYEDGVRRLCALVEGLPPDRLETPVPACPAWTARQLLAHLAGVAADAEAGRYFAGAVEAWHDPRLAEQRDRWTAGHVEDRSDRDVATLLDEVRHAGAALVQALRTGHGPAADVPRWMLGSPAADLAVHLDDLAEALGTETAPDSDVTRTGFALYRRWLAARIAHRGLPALRLTDGEHEWLAGAGEPAATLRAGRDELFRTISGRRSAAAITRLHWEGAAAPYLDVLSPYPLPADPAA